MFRASDLGRAIASEGLDRRFEFPLSGLTPEPRWNRATAPESFVMVLFLVDG